MMQDSLSSEAAKELKLEASTFPGFPMSPLIHSSEKSRREREGGNEGNHCYVKTRSLPVTTSIFFSISKNFYFLLMISMTEKTNTSPHSICKLQQPLSRDYKALGGGSGSTDVTGDGVAERGSGS